MKKLLIFLSLLIGVSIFVASQSRKSISVKASLDSAYILMGNKTSIHIEIVGELDGTGYFVNNDTAWKTLELSSESEPTLSDLGNNRKELKKDLIIQGFDSGMYTIPPIVYVQGNETIASNAVSLKVIPVNVDTLRTIHDYADVESPGSNFFDFIPDWMTDYGWWILLGLIVIAGGIYLYVIWRKGKLKALIKKKKVLPPYDVAMIAFRELKSKNLCERGQEKLYYTDLTDILRNYLAGRFGINAMEMTTSQIRQSLLENEATKPSEPLISKVLEIADFVKFAKVRPMPSDNTAAFINAVQFVEDTKPTEEPEKDENDDSIVEF